MTEFKHPTNSSEYQPCQETDAAPLHHEVADCSEQAVVPGEVAEQLGATACQEAFCQMCAHYREAEVNATDPATGQGPDDVDERIEKMTEVSVAKSGIRWDAATSRCSRCIASASSVTC